VVDPVSEQVGGEVDRSEVGLVTGAGEGEGDRAAVFVGEAGEDVTRRLIRRGAGDGLPIPYHAGEPQQLQQPARCRVRQLKRLVMGEPAVGVRRVVRLQRIDRIQPQLHTTGLTHQRPQTPLRERLKIIGKEMNRVPIRLAVQDPIPPLIEYCDIPALLFSLGCQAPARKRWLTSTFGKSETDSMQRLPRFI